MAVGFPHCEMQLCYCSVLLCAGLPYEDLLELRFGFDICDTRFGSFHIGVSLCQLRAVITVVDAKQNVTRPNRLIVPDFDSDDITPDLRSQRSNVAADVS